MKNLKYIQLFEAFDSRVLSKTLGYIKDKNDKDKFLTQIKKMCNAIDYPISKLNDNYFEYLPFKKALNVAAMTGDEPCEATSASEFPEYAIEGAKCENGKIKRKWGARTREVVCPVCNGTGVKPKRSELKLLKFWFTSDGKYIATTMVDGVIRGGKGSMSYNSTHYDVIKEITNLNELSNGDFIKVNIGGVDMIARIYKDGWRTYAIQNQRDGSTPQGPRSSWQKYGKFAWALGRGEYSSISLVKPKAEIDDEADPYTWNVACTFNYGGVNVSSSDVQSLIKDAHFGIVFDFGKLKKSDFERKSDISFTREEAKKGSKLDPNFSDEEIKRKNIERYVNALSQKLDITQDIANCNRLVTRAIGGRRGALYVVYSTDIYSRFSYMISDYLKLLSANDDSNKKAYANDISDRSESLFKAGMKTATSTQETIKEIKARINQNNLDDDYIKALDKLQNLSDAIFNSINNFQIDSVEDFEVLNQKISSIRNVLKADRYNLSRFMDYVVGSISNNRAGRAYDYLTDTYYFSDINVTVSNLDRVINIISKI